MQFDSMIPTSNKHLTGGIDVQAIIADRSKYKSVLEVGEDASPRRKKVGLSDLNMARPIRRGLTLEDYNQGNVENIRESHVIADRWTPPDGTSTQIRVHDSRTNTGVRFDVKNQSANPNHQPDPYQQNLVQGIPRSSGKPMVGLSTMNGPTCSK